MSNDNESFRLGLEAGDRAFNSEDCKIRLTDEMVKEVVEVYCSLGPDPQPRKVKAACTFEALCRITQTTREDWERDFGQRFISSDLTEFSAGFFEEVNAEQRRRFFAARRL
jgi:hypothetical protein